MKRHYKIFFGAFTAVLVLAGLTLFFSCKREATLKLGSVPTPDFNAVVGSDGHSVTLLNKSDIASIPYWSVPDLNLSYGDLQGDSVKVNFIFPGTYTIKMMVVGNGGLDSLTKTVTTTQPDANACSSSTALGFLASCTQKTWKLKPTAGTLWVSQFAGGEGNWWQSGDGDVTARPCTFNDTYTFKFNKAGDFIYNDGGDFYAEDYSGDPAWSCRASSTYPANQANWASGNFKYALIAGGGVKGLGQIKVIGTGAHIGLNKPINNNEVSTSSTTAITYDIWSMQSNITDALGTYDQLVITFHYGSWSATEGWWTFTLISMH
jgi:PKD repeat protein